VIDLPSSLDATEPLWMLGDGTGCVLAECDHPPRYAVSLMRHAQVVRQRRVYGEASARVLAENWRQSAGGQPCTHW
jgi:hypothetical protein